jgi:hypothetical protein
MHLLIAIGLLSRRYHDDCGTTGSAIPAVGVRSLRIEVHRVPLLEDRLFIRDIHSELPSQHIDELGPWVSVQLRWV